MWAPCRFTFNPVFLSVEATSIFGGKTVLTEALVSAESGHKVGFVDAGKGPERLSLTADLSPFRKRLTGMTKGIHKVTESIQ